MIIRDGILVHLASIAVSPYMCRRSSFSMAQLRTQSLILYSKDCRGIRQLAIFPEKMAAWLKIKI